jgi:hypothetical protein
MTEENVHASTKRIVGDGWAALLQVGKWLHLGRQVEWHRPNPIGVDLVTASFADWESAEGFSALAREFGVETGACREHPRAYSGRQRQWVALTNDDREEFSEMDRVLIPDHEFSFERSLVDVLHELRSKIESHPNLKWVDQLWDGVPIDARGNIWETKERKKAKPFGILQLAWDHPEGMWNQEGIPVLNDQTLELTLNRDSGESLARHVVGRLSNHRQKSVWSAAVSSEELADHPAIVRKIRKIKQAIGKAIQGSMDESMFLNESVRAFDPFLSAQLPPQKASPLGILLSDGKGLSGAMHQILDFAHPPRSESKTQINRPLENADAEVG